MNEPFVGKDGKTYNTEIDVSHLEIYGYDCEKCGEEFLWGKPETVKYELCWGCMQDKVIELSRPKGGRKQRPRWYNKRTGETYTYKGRERFGMVLVATSGNNATHSILAENLGEL